MITDSIKSHLLELESLKTDIEGGIARLKINKAPIFTKTDVMDFLRPLRTVDLQNVRCRIYLVETLLSRAYVFDDGRLVMQLNFTGSDSVVTRQMAADSSIHS